MFDALRKLFGGEDEKAKKRGRRPAGSKPGGKKGAAPKATAPQEPKGPPRLKPIDAAMIQSRMRALDVNERLEPSHREELKHLVLEQCRKGKEGVWWTPLASFVRGLRYHAQGLPIYVLKVQAGTPRQLHESALGAVGVMSQHGLMGETLRSPAGSTQPDDQPAVDGEYALLYRIKARTTHSPVPLTVKDGRIDVDAFVGAMNQVLKAQRMGELLIALTEYNGERLVLACPAPIAERAANSGWGSLGPA